jgi:hypothetical protein
MEHIKTWITTRAWHVSICRSAFVIGAASSVPDELGKDISQKENQG